MGSPRAAVDVGTNSVRLLVEDAAGARLLRRMTITRLGRGVDEVGHLDDDALERTLAVLRDYRSDWQDRGVPRERIRIAATSAIRDAADRERFFAGVEEATGVVAEVITGEEEAGLAYRGAIAALAPPRPTAVLDLGGGSTELVVGHGPDEVAGRVSVQLGSVRVTERLLTTDPPTPGEIASAAGEVGERLAEADRRLTDQGADVRDARSLVGVAGTVTTVAALHLGLSGHDEERIHGARVPAGALRDLTHRLLGMTTSERARLGPVQEGRADVIAGGALILNGVVHRYGFDAVLASEADSLDGLAASIDGSG